MLIVRLIVINLGERFQDYSWIQDFYGLVSIERQPQNPQFRKIKKSLNFCSLSNDSWPFKILIVDKLLTYWNI